MSDYRDDSHDIAVASSSVFLGVKGITEDVIRISDAVFFGLAIMCSSTAIASDEVMDTSVYFVSDTATVSDDINHTLHASQRHTDKAKASDSLSYGIRIDSQDTAIASDELIAGALQSFSQDTAIASDEVTAHRTVSVLSHDTATMTDDLISVKRELLEDTAIASDSSTGKLQAADFIEDSAIASDYLMGGVIAINHDTAIASDEFFGVRSAYVLVEDKSVAHDELLFGQTALCDDSAIMSDTFTGRLYARNTIDDTASASDEVIDKISQPSVITDTAIASDSVTSRLIASFSWHDIAVAQDEVINIGGYGGQTWTANVDSWAMSRYNPYNYKRIVVINDVLYGEADDGIYRLDQEVMPVVASVKTGKIDLGRGAITHPAAAYLEYELVGQASMTVHTTQKGIEQQYAYVLPSKLAGELTNGRFIFGRGLRGRHFSFDLTMVGTHGYVNDLSIDHQPTSRRV